MVDVIKRLRELTSLGVSDCKKALDEAKGDFDTALDICKKRGISVARGKGERKTSQGLVDSYVHFGGNLGALVEVNCETDFVARTDMFKKFTKDVAMQVAATNPAHVTREEISAEELGKIGNIEQYAKEHCLLEQVFIKDNALSVGDYLKQVIAQTGENVIIKRFARFSLEG